MDHSRFISIIKQGVTGNDDIRDLQELTNTYPFFQSAQMFLAKAFHDQNNIHYDKQLKIAAAYSPDRKALHRLIHQTNKNIQHQDFSSPFILEPIEEPVKVIPVFPTAETFVEPVQEIFQS